MIFSSVFHEGQSLVLIVSTSAAVRRWRPTTALAVESCRPWLMRTVTSPVAGSLQTDRGRAKELPTSTPPLGHCRHGVSGGWRPSMSTRLKKDFRLHTPCLVKAGPQRSSTRLAQMLEGGEPTA